MPPLLLEALVSEHTPTPWRLEGYSIYSSAHKGRHIVATSDPYWGLNQNKANAAFIVKAVNSHEALVKALELCKGALEACSQMHPDNRGIATALEAARTAAQGKGDAHE